MGQELVRSPGCLGLFCTFHLARLFPYSPLYPQAQGCRYWGNVCLLRWMNELNNSLWTHFSILKMRNWRNTKVKSYPTAQRSPPRGSLPVSPPTLRLDLVPLLGSHRARLYILSSLPWSHWMAFVASVCFHVNIQILCSRACVCFIPPVHGTEQVQCLMN